MDPQVPDAAEEAALVSAAQEGDEAAVTRIVSLHADSVYRIARGIVGGDADAEDVVQDAFVRALRALPRFRGDAQLGTWLHRITVNTALHHLERRRSETTRRHGAAEQQQSVPLPSPAAPDDAIERRELRDAVRDMLDELPPEQRAVVVLRELEGLTARETAAILECPVPTVDSRLVRARARMRELWQRFDPARD